MAGELLETEEPRAEIVFNAAMDVSCPRERSALVDQLCKQNLELAKEVHSLLSASARAGGFLENIDPDDSLPVDPPMVYNASADVTQQPKSNSSRSGRSSRVGVNEVPFRRFGSYELIEVIAHGGMGVVYKARQTGLNRVVALKMILTGTFADSEEIKRFYQEAEAAAKIDHPGIVPVYDVGCHEGQHYYSMAFIEGESLAARIKESPIDPRESARILFQVASAVHCAHEAGFIHRDLKPANILLDETNEPRIVDFGLAKSTLDDSNLTRTGTVMGTPNYMPPEQATGKNEEVTSASDVYSLGAILYTLLTRQPPFVSGNSTETLMQVLQDEPLRASMINAAIPRDLEAICTKCMEKKPADRYASAAELAQDLARFLAGASIYTRNDWKRRSRRWVAREPVLAAHLALVPILIFALFIAQFLTVDGPNAFTEIDSAFWRNVFVLFAWGGVSVVLQKTHNRVRSAQFIPTIWAAVDPLFLAGLLCLNNEPRGLLLSSFPLLILVISLFRRVDLIAVATVSSIFGFGMVLIYALTIDDLNPRNSLVTSSYNIVFTVVLLLTGIISSLQAQILNRLTRAH
jgi:serine/threonine protein kinase